MSNFQAGLENFPGYLSKLLHLRHKQETIAMSLSARSCLLENKKVKWD